MEFQHVNFWQIESRCINSRDIKTSSVRLKGILGIETKDDTGDVSIPDFVAELMVESVCSSEEHAPEDRVLEKRDGKGKEETYRSWRPTLCPCPLKFLPSLFFSEFYSRLVGVSTAVIRHHD